MAKYYARTVDPRWDNPLYDSVEDALNDRMANAYDDYIVVYKIEKVFKVNRSVEDVDVDDYAEAAEKASHMNNERMNINTPIEAQ